MQRIFKALIIALASFGLAAGAGSALAQKVEPPKDAAKKAETAAKDATTKAADKAKDEVKAKAEPKKEEPKAAAAGPMDINSASAAELATLKGIGDARAKAIIKGRGKHGYKGKDDLVKKKIIPQNVYDDIKDQIIAKQEAKPEAPKKK